MRTRRPLLETVATVALFAVLCLSLPTSPAVAGWIPTTAAVATSQARLVSVLERQEIADALAALGVDPAEAARRAAGLSDAEALQALERFDSLPAGGNPFVAIAGLTVFVFLVLLLTDILGYTDVYPFVKRTAQ